MEIVIFSFTKKASQLSTTLNHKLNKEAYEFITNLNCKNKNENNLIYNITSYTPKKYITNDTLTELPYSSTIFQVRKCTYIYKCLWYCCSFYSTICKKQNNRPLRSCN